MDSSRFPANFITKPLPRRLVLKSLLAVLVSGCARSLPGASGGQEVSTGAPPPTATPWPLLAPRRNPTPTPTPPPSADGIAQAYLAAWSTGDYEAMYNLLTQEGRSRLTRQEFQGQYLYARHQATATNITARLNSLLNNNADASAIFHSSWQTALFGNLEVDHPMTLRYEDGRWRVVWQPSLIMPQLSEGVTLALLDEVPVRGNIYDKNAHALASQGQMVTVGVVPAFIENVDQVLAQLEPITGLSQDFMRGKIAAAQPDWFVPLASVSFETSVEFDDLLNSLPGVERRAQAIRTYSEGDLAAHLVGYVGPITAEAIDDYRARGYRGDEIVGLSGVEAWAESFLAGRRGGRLVTLTPSKKVQAEIATALPRPGGSVYLSIDSGLQASAEAILGARPGAIVVLDPNSGFVLALATWPRFDPQQFASGISTEQWLALNHDPLRPLFNRATQGTYPPASIFKLVSAAAAMEHLGYTAQTSFFCSGAWHGLGENFVKKCWLETGHGNIDLVNGIIQSCDVVFYEIGLALHQADPSLLPAMARSFGLGQLTGLKGASEEAGVVPDNDWKTANLGEAFFEGDAVNMAIGQGYLLTSPLQIANMLAAIGNGGTLYQPQLIERFSNRAIGDQYSSPEARGTLPLAPETLATLRRGLAGVVSGARGTARRAFDGWAYTAAGKTGTAETGISAPHAWFAGYTPADEPRVAITVVLENAGEGSEHAAPIFRLMAETFFNWEATRA
ncbi:MAG: penicillin-binding protein 2 [Anaerolineae bacterium]